MDYLKQFSIPFKGMLDGVHHYTFELDEDFFRRFPASPFGPCNIQTDLNTDKQGSLMTVNINVTGSAMVNCDRCLAEISLPVAGSYQIIVKQATGTSDDPDLFLISPEENEWNIAELIYEYCCLSLPMSRTINCGEMNPAPCNREVLSKITEDKVNLEGNALWDELKKLNLK
ncbi:MAG TPA: DUF177 domain-containing protein [Saprospiraceae bacterium]|nr:DUF177 domain-containing protein [Saprospiraceae bacterium]HMX87469.1 DUF177 domain-containing protein [Saprospiraceae bacterium]HMZ39652.1 DUF177 domain-containing protein [Saprospiraceae bacterium]HNA63564.1 DUF177 domain-containing protein [Saprospiraceae bacterium]HNB29980.1 DUF177 domain-containing protein [Saprospiraceae bacterium]